MTVVWLVLVVISQHVPMLVAHVFIVPYIMELFIQISMAYLGTFYISICLGDASLCHG